jgi:hypothetical protein
MSATIDCHAYLQEVDLSLENESSALEHES